MGLGLFLVPTVGGYWFLTHLNYTRYRVFRDSGYHVLFSSAFCGALLFGGAHFIILLLYHQFPQLGVWWDCYFPAEYSDTVVLSVILGVVLPPVFNRLHRLPFSRATLTSLRLVGILCYDSEGAARRAAQENNDFVELLMTEAFFRGEFAEISLRSGKSYIGFALESGIKCQQGEPDIALIPVASGYRNKDTQELEITTHYSQVIENSLEAEMTRLSYEDFRIVIPMSEIVSARLFFPEAYTLFQIQGELSVTGK